MKEQSKPEANTTRSFKKRGSMDMVGDCPRVMVYTVLAVFQTHIGDVPSLAKESELIIVEH